ncbi:50S ribosomal protein L20 [bacterium]|nr:50S ribosomal protein L20 [bacterium]
MVRVKRGNVARNRRKKVLKMAKGYRGGTSKLFRQARQSVLQALRHMYVDRRDRKGDFRELWIVRINAALDGLGLSYSGFMGKMKQKNIQLNRKTLAELAAREPRAFEQVVGVVTAQ